MSYKNNSNTNEKYSILSPKIDVVFQLLFGEVGSENITKDLLSCILDEEINEVDLNQNVVLRRNLPDGKMGIVDVLAKINNNEYCNIEMQMIDKKNIIKRILYYWSRQYCKELHKGDNYSNLKRTIIVLIANFELDNLHDLNFHTKWKIIEFDSRKIVLTEDFELNIIEIPKMYRSNVTGKDEKLKQWLSFLENPESSEVYIYMKNNESMKSAKEKLDTISKDDKLRRIAELREKAILDEKEAEYTGFSKGLEQGRKEGLAEGHALRNREIAKNMKSENIDIELIIKLTGLTKKEIEEL